MNVVSVPKSGGKNAGGDAGATKSKCCGVDGGDAGFDSDAVYFYGFGEDGALKAVGQDFQDVANFGRASGVSQNLHGFGGDLIDAYAGAQACWFFCGGSGGLFDGFLHDSIITG